MANKPTYEELEQRVEDLEKEDMKPKRMGEALRKSEEHYRILIETIPHGIQEIDTTGTLTFVNDAYCRLMGYEEREVLGKPIFDFIEFETPSGKEELREYLKLLVNDQPLRTSFFQRNRRKDGKVLDVQVDWNYKRNEQGLVTGFISVLTDITEHRKSQEELRKVHRDLEKKVGERTAELTEVNEQLNREIEGHKQTEVELRESEERFRSLVETTSDWIWEVDSSGVYTYCSPRAEELLGYKPEELIGRTPFDLMPPDEAESVTTVFREKVTSQTPFERLENVNFHKDGTLLVLETSGVPIFDAKGDLLGYRGIDRDITERKKSEEELRENGARFRALFEGSLDAIFLADAESGKIFDANPVASELLLRDHDEIIGLHYLELYPPHWTETAEKAYAKLLQIEELQKPLETVLLRSDGTEVSVEAVSQIIQIDGIPVIHGVVRDISQRKQMVEELGRSEEHFRTLAEASLAGIFIFQDGTFRYANPALGRIFGYDANEMVKERMGLAVTYPEDRETAEDYIRQCSENRPKGSPVLSFRGVRSNGDVIDCELLAGVVDYKGRRAVIGTILDVTDRKRMEEELARTQKLESLGVLAGGIAHDFNNILTAISTNISMARMYGNLEDDISQMMADAEKASLRAKNLTQQLLAFAKGGRPIKTTVSIAQLLRDTAEFALSGSNVQSEYSIPEDLWFATVDEGQIGQVINNLVINADQAMPEGGTIDISAENVLVGEHDQIALEKGKYVRVSLKDQGIGISQKHLNKIFDPFFTTKQKGSGLGLATSFTIVKNHGGHIGVHSEPDIGTTVDVYLPASEEAFETGAIEKKRPIKGEGRVLLIDDEEMIRRSTGEMLKRFGYDVKLAKDGEEGLKFYKKARESGLPFDAVIMDLTIRGGRGGKETVRELMKINPDAKVIVSSGYSDDPVMSEFGEYGFVGVVEKPYRIEDLGALLDKVIAEERR